MTALERLDHALSALYAAAAYAETALAAYHHASGAYYHTSHGLLYAVYGALVASHITQRRLLWTWLQANARTPAGQLVLFTLVQENVA
jgi:hypothetical protein